MNDNLLLIIILCVALAVAGGIGAYFLMRFLRGSIKLHLPVTSFQPGDEIKGRFDLHAKKAIEGKRLIVSLIGTEHRRHRQNGKSETQTQEIFRKETLVEEARSYPAGTQQSYNFALRIPEPNETEEKVQAWAKGLDQAVNMMTGSRRRVVWKVEARLDAKGIDLVGSQTVSVND